MLSALLALSCSSSEGQGGSLASNDASAEAVTPPAPVGPSRALTPPSLGTSAAPLSGLGPTQLLSGGNGSIAGMVFEDVGYGGGAGRSRTTTGVVAVRASTVELYDVGGTGAKYLSSTSTASDGTYSFSSVSCGLCAIRTVTSSVRSARSGSTSSLLPVVTFETDVTNGGTPVAVTDHVGGFWPKGTDAAAAASGAEFDTSTGQFYKGLSGYAQAFAVVKTNGSGGSVTGVDFGFNFDTVTSANDTGAGSLRQVLTNANTLGGDSSLAQTGRTVSVENVVFMIPNGTTGSGGTAKVTGGLRSNIDYTSSGAVTLTPPTPLPLLTSAVVLDAQVQPGFTSAPIVRIDGASLSSGGNYGLYASVDGVTIRGFSITNFVETSTARYANAGIGVQGWWWAKACSSRPWPPRWRRVRSLGSWPSMRPATCSGPSWATRPAAP